MFFSDFLDGWTNLDEILNEWEPAGYFLIRNKSCHKTTWPRVKPWDAASTKEIRVKPTFNLMREAVESKLFKSFDDTETDW